MARRLIASVVFSVLLFLCHRADADDIRIGMSAAFSGPSRGLGIELYRGSMAYFESINNSGGIAGNRLRLIAYDDRYDPVSAIENTIRLAEQDRVLLLIDYVGTPTVTRILPLLKRYSGSHLYLFFPFTGAQFQREPPYDQYVFNLRASYREETAALVDRFVEAGRKKVAIFYQIDSYGRSGWEGVKRALSKYGLKIASEATYRRGAGFDVSMKRQVQILKAANPDVIISVGAYAACAAFIRDARDAGWNVPIANISFVGSENLVQLLLQQGATAKKDYTRNLINSQVVPSYEDVSLPAVREYRSLMSRNHPALPASLVPGDYMAVPYSFAGFEGYLNARLLVEVLRKIGDKIDASRIRQTVEALGSVDLGIGSPAIFNPQRHQALDSIYYTTVENGRVVPLRDWSRWRIKR